MRLEYSAAVTITRPTLTRSGYAWQSSSCVSNVVSFKGELGSSAMQENQSRYEETDMQVGNISPLWQPLLLNFASTDQHTSPFPWNSLGNAMCGPLAAGQLSVRDLCWDSLWNFPKRSSLVEGSAAHIYFLHTQCTRICAVLSSSRGRHFRFVIS